MPHRLGKRRIMEDDPYVPPQNPFQVFLLVLSLAAALPLIAGDSGSASLERELPDVTVTMWGWALLIGSALALIGLWTPASHALFGLTVERAGLILVGGAALIYAYVILDAAGTADGVRYAVAVQSAYGLACGWRCIQLWKAIRWSKAHMKPQEG